MRRFLIDPKVPLVWRLQKAMTGTGVLGDLGSPIIDLVEWLTDQRIVSLWPICRPLSMSGLLPDGSGMGQVNMDDGATFLARFVNGAMGTFVSSLYATARRNHQRVKIYGDQGALVYQWEDTDHLQAAVGPVFVDEGQWMSMPIPQRFKATEPEESANFTQSIIEDKEMQPNFQDGLRNQEILEAVETSARDRHEVDLPLAA